MTFNSYAYYLQGKHLGTSKNIPCQDFALSGESEGTNNSFVCLSDGCSSSPGSDLGARLLCYLTAKKLKTNQAVYECELIQEAEEITKTLGCEIRHKMDFSSSRVLDATLAYAVENEKTIDISFFGDGTTYLKMKDGSYKFYDIEYTSNAPYYLSYLIYGSESYKEFFGKDKKILTYLHFKISDEEKLFELKDFSYDHVEVLDSSSTDISLYDKFYLSENKDDLSAAMITSDGIGSFQSSLSEQIIHERIFSQILPKIKSPLMGDPLERRMNKFKKDYEKLGWFPNDDLSIGLLIRA